jgi:enhancing lycopene biosynthesis protein 2
MEEAARIARGPVFDIAEADPADFDALVMPGGFGAAKNLSSFAIDGADLSVDDGVAAFLRGMFEAGKPIGVACISPVVVAKVLGKSGIELTIGSDTDTAAAIEKLGARHVVKKVTEIHRDPKHPLVSTPAYMYEAPIREVAEGLEAMVAEVMKML